MFESVAAGYSGYKVGPFNLSILFGQKIVLIGPNGSGKSTILKCLFDKNVVLGGEVRIDSKIVLGNFMQQHDDLPVKMTVIEFLRERLGGEDRDLLSLAVKHGFPAEARDALIGVLSPGERARLLFALFSGKSANVLLLDEPTNHLDLEAVEALTEMLETYEGSILLVTHDRALLENECIDTYYLVSDGKVSPLLDYEEYIQLAQKKAKRLLSSL